MGVFVIAEAGINHCGSVRRALDMVQVAHDCGADAVKFQSFTADKLGYDEALTAQLRDWQLTAHDHTVLKEYADSIGIEFMSTPFDFEWTDFLVALGVKRLKISSGKVKDLAFVRHVASKGLPVIMSAGMVDADGMTAAILAKSETGYDLDLALMYCVSKYPAPLSDIDFREMERLNRRYDRVTIGYSDHSANPTVSILAAAAGAQVIEAHLTLDRALPGPDHAASLLPGEFAEMVRGVRNVGA